MLDMLEPPGVVLDRFPWMLFAQKVAAQNPKQTLQTNTWKIMETLVHVSATSHKSSNVHVKALHVELRDYRVKGASDHISTRKRHVIRDPKTRKPDQNGSFAVLFSASALSSFELQSSNYWNY